MKQGSMMVPVVGLDVSEQHIQACEIVDGEILETSRFKNRPAVIKKRFANAAPRRFVIEVGSHTRWIAELLTSLGHTVVVLDPRRLKLISDSLQKDDRLDAERLAFLAATLPEELLVTVKLRGRAHQEALTLVRARATVVKARTMTINAIRGLLKPYAVRISKKGRSGTFVKEAREKLGDSELARLVEPMLQTLEALTRAIGRYDKQVEGTLHALAPDAVHLSSIHGVGALTVLYFVALVGDPYRFAKSRNIGPYLGLTRRRDDSGNHTSELGITKAGDPLMRALLSNCASHIIGPFGADSDLRQWGLLRGGGGKGAVKRKAKTAVARKLAVLMLTLWKSGEQYEPFRTPPVAKAA